LNGFFFIKTAMGVSPRATEAFCARRLPFRTKDHVEQEAKETTQL
jgi:hypothetical protein